MSHRCPRNHNKPNEKFGPRPLSKKILNCFLGRHEMDGLGPRLDELHRAALLRSDFRGFGAALQLGEGKLALIAEVKKASPSAGVIAESFEPVAVAKNYARAGVEAISVLTDQRFFQGHLDYLQMIRSAVPQPLLRKDF